MPTPTFTKIASYTVSGTSTTSITFSAIPSAYQDLLLYVSASLNRGGTYNLDTFIQVNSQSTAANYTGGYIYVDQNTTSQSVTSNPSMFPVNANGSTAYTYSNYWIYIPSYRSTTLVDMLYFGGAGDFLAQGNGATVFGTAAAPTGEAISSLTLKDRNGNNFNADSTFYLYGIKSS